MDIKQGKIKNLNKKIIAGTLGITLLSSAIVGYSVSNRIKLDRQRYENFVGIASFEKMKNCCFVEIYNKQEETTEYYIAEKNEFYNKNKEVMGYMYLDVLERKNIFVDRFDDCSSGVGFIEDFNKTLVEELNIKDYLYDFNMVESMYSENDITKLLEQIKESNSKDNSKNK